MASEVESQPKSYVISLHGDLGLAEVERVSALLPDPSLIEDRLVLDCTNVTSMDSTILALIMTYRQKLALAQRDATSTIVAIVPPRIVRLFELTGISRSITVLPLEMPTD